MKRLYRGVLSAYGDRVDPSGPMWRPKYYVFNVFSEIKAREKLDYMHNNPVKAGLADNIGRTVRPGGIYFGPEVVGVDIKAIS